MSRAQVLIAISIVVLSIGFANSATARTAEPNRSSRKASVPASGAYDVLQFNYDAQHSGGDTLETTITKSNVFSLRQTFQVTITGGIADGVPVYLSAVNTPGGVQDLLFLSTVNGYIYALNAHTGARVWSHQYAAGSCTFGNPPMTCFSPASPAIDPNRQYVYSYGLDGNIHKYQVGDGTEITGGGWPEPTTAKNFEKVTTNLSIATAKNGTSYLYVGHSTEEGSGDYQGHLTTINLTDGSQHVFNAVCSNQVDIYFVAAPGTPDCAASHAGIWARSGAVYDPDTDKIYVTTGDGPFDVSQFYWGYSVLELNPDGAGSGGGMPVDSYTYPNWQTLGNHDPGSTAPAILPTPSNSSFKHLAVQGGKDGMLRLLNLDNLSGQGGPGNVGGEISIIAFPPGGEILTAPAVWVNPSDGTTWVFYANNFGTAGLQLAVDSSGTPSLKPMWTSATHGTSPIVANGVLFIATAHLIRALDPVSGNQLWADTNIAGLHFESPLVANGMLYITDESRTLTAYSLGPVTSEYLPLILK